MSANKNPKQNTPPDDTEFMAQYDKADDKEKRRLAAGMVAARAALKEERDRLEDIAFHDDLTGALNRAGLKEELKKASPPKAIIIVDATNFKAVNDIGYSRGDEMIKETYGVLQKSTRSNDVIARWGGDEFLILVNGTEPETETDEPKDGLTPRTQTPTSEELIEIVEGRINQEVQSMLGMPNNQDVRDVGFDLAAGGVVWDGNKNLDELIEAAEIKMKDVKAQQHG